MSDLSDPRFSRIAFDPKFKPVQHAQRKVKVDNRFAAMFTEEAFKANTTKDKRGRPFAQRQAEGLDRFYELEREGNRDDDDEEDEEDESENEEQGSDSSGSDEEQSESDSSDSDDEEDDDVSSKVNESKAELGSDWDELDKDAPVIDEATTRIAICNLDWQSVKAADLFALLTSLLPQNAEQRLKKNAASTSAPARRGTLKSVEIFPSQFGLKRMLRERVEGPVFEEKEATADPSNVSSDAEEKDANETSNASINQRKQKQVRGRKGQSEMATSDAANDDDAAKATQSKSRRARRDNERAALNRLRKYELERLKYYFAIAEFDTVSTAQYVYENCDGCEYESSGMRLDLRFVPDGVSFDDERRDRDAAITANPDDTVWRIATQCYTMPADEAQLTRLAEAKTFTYSALLQTNKIDLGWDRTDNDRQRTILRANTISKNELEKMDLKAYLHNSDSESDKDPEAGEESDEDGAVGHNLQVAGSDSESSEAESLPDSETKPKSKSKKSKSAKKQSEIEKYRALIRELEENEGRGKRKKKQRGSDSEGSASGGDDDDFKMEISWDRALEEARKASEEEDEEEEDTKGKDQRGNKKRVRQADKKRKIRRLKDEEFDGSNTEGRKKSTAELSLIVGDDAADRRAAKRNFAFDARDERFAAMYSAPEYNVDPSAREFRQAFTAKRNAAEYLSAVANEKAKRRKRV